jgi:hypothetical protein
MEKEILDRLEKIENKLNTEKKDFWEKLSVLTPILIPLAIAFVGWYFTNEHNKNQLELQKENNENQRQIALINSSVGQSGLIKDFVPHLNSKDSTERNIAMIAILYAAPAPGKEIVDKIAKSDDNAGSKVANDALNVKRNDLINNLFSFSKHNRLIAANEIISSWTNDAAIVEGLLSKVESCLSDNNEIVDCNNGIFNTIIVLRNFPEDLLRLHKVRITELASLLPAEGYDKTRNELNVLLQKIE